MTIEEAKIQAGELVKGGHGHDLPFVSLPAVPGRRSVPFIVKTKSAGNTGGNLRHDAIDAIAEFILHVSNNQPLALENAHDEADCYLH